MKNKRKQRRTFSEAFKREKVNLIDEGKLSVKEVSKIYEVSDRAVYKWLQLYSKYPSDEQIVVQKISEAQKTLELHHKVKELEQALGRKQLELDYFKEVVKIISDEEGEDVTKKYKPKQ